MAVGKGGITRSAPANATCGDGSASIRSNIPATNGISIFNACYTVSSYSRSKGVDRNCYTRRNGTTILVCPRHRIGGGSSR